MRGGGGRGDGGRGKRGETYKRERLSAAVYGIQSASIMFVPQTESFQVFVHCYLTKSRQA